MLKGMSRKWLIVVTVILLLILIPFFLFGDQIESWTEQFLETSSDKQGLIALVLGGLLSLDIILPTPSSLVMVACGFILGFWKGFLVAFIGNTISVILGYWLGANAGRLITSKWVGEEECEQLEDLYNRIGDWVIVVSRAVPVMAETSVIFAGMSKMKYSRFILMATLSNLALSAVYAFVGAFSGNVNSFLLAFFGAILLPALAMLITRTRRARNAKPVVTDSK
jgi:membrane protein DedA with SNARE-associated domain